MKLFFLILLSTCFQIFGQHLGITFQDAEKKGISVPKLEGEYKSAINFVDSSVAVFKTEVEQKKVSEAWFKLLKDFGKFLSDNNFKWEKPTRCFNKIYFNNNGAIDYFLYNFLGEKENIPSDERQKEFNSLLNLFISNYKFPLTANVKFAQCGPITFKPKEK